MNKVKIIFCFFVFLLFSLYVLDLFRDVNILNFILKKDRNFLTVETLTNTNFQNPRSFLDFDDVFSLSSKEESGVVESEKKVSKNLKPIIYFYNTHQTEEYATGIHGITPTVETVSTIMHDELEGLGIGSIVEERSITKEVKKRGYDYSGTYTVSLEYLKDMEKKNPSLKYFFDMHRDSITGSSAKVKIGNNSYAKMMFLVGAKMEECKQSVGDIKIMEKYLEKNYPGILRDTYYQGHSCYNQNYRDKMFLVELGGPDNTLEEIYNTSKALSEAISYYLEVLNEK